MSDIVLVEILDEDIKKRNGPFHHYGREIAIRGEQKGLWRIVPEEGTYSHKIMETKINYLEKDGFGKGLSFNDLYGEDKQK